MINLGFYSWDLVMAFYLASNPRYTSIISQDPKYLYTPPSRFIKVYLTNKICIYLRCTNVAMNTELWISLGNPDFIPLRIYLEVGLQDQLW